MRRTLVIGLIVIVMTVTCLQYSASAATTVNYDDSGNVTSVEGLIVPGIGTYDVDFFWGAYDEIFGDNGWDFDTKEDAAAVVNALNSCLNEEEPIPDLIYFADYGSPSLPGRPLPHYHVPFYNISDIWVAKTGTYAYGSPEEWVGQAVQATEYGSRTARYSWAKIKVGYPSEAKAMPWIPLLLLDE